MGATNSWYCKLLTHVLCMYLLPKNMLVHDICLIFFMECIKLYYYSNTGNLYMSENIDE